MCCASTDYKKEEINGTCESCGSDTVNGDGYYCCSYSPTNCEDCGTAYCDQSC